MSPRICLVTGSNKGIGFEAVRQISKLYSNDDVVYLTSRDKQRGSEALKTLNDEGLKNLRYLQLDLEDTSTIKSAASAISKEHGKLDVLVNNAGFAYKNASPAPFQEQAEVTNRINYFGTLNVINAFIPLLKNGRIVNVASFAGRLAQVAKDHQSKLTSPHLKIEELSAYINDFIEKTKTNSHRKAGYSNTAYGMSKLGMIALSNIFARELAGENIAVVSMCPGWCKTDMAGTNAPNSAADGADIVTYLATKDNIMELSGKFIREKAVAVW